MSEAAAKQLCTSFFYWWYNQPGANTEDGFDEWAKGPGKELIATTGRAARAGNINDLVAYFHGKSKAAGWWEDMATGEDLTKNPYVIATKLMLVVSEVSEAMEGLRKNLMDDKLPHRPMAEVEFGDALIRICDLAGALKYDLGGATVEKDAYNDVRADHKVGNRMLAGGKAF
jgi:hypothetical protein